MEVRSFVDRSSRPLNIFRACYADGALTSVKAGANSDPKPCAGNDGTTITVSICVPGVSTVGLYYMLQVENLFYNTPTRLSALRGSSEEYTRILDVVTRYAIHNPLVSFTCKKVSRTLIKGGLLLSLVQTGSPSPDVSTPSSSTTEQAIRLLYGQTLAKELLHVSVPPSSKGKGKASAQDHASDDEDVDVDDSWNAEAHFTNANYQAKKMTFLLFINRESEVLTERR